MIAENIRVKHKAFGDGIISEVNGTYITVSFENCIKKFVYPDAFDKYLTLSDGTVSDDIVADIAISKQAKQAIIDKKNEENLRAMTRGIVIPGKEITAENEEDDYHNNKDSFDA